jgi:adenosylmethionine-8-amino-7-oxononanoate aminotransferase
MSFHYWRNVGRSSKRRFITLSNSYHGETLGALAVGNVALYKEIYQPLLMDVITVPAPDCFGRAPGESWAECSWRLFAEMKAALARHADETCAVIVEPLVQCAGGMRMYDPVYLSLLREACDRHQVHLIADEIAVGFGRTGTMFACEQVGCEPDMLVLGKGLGGGVFPMAALIAREDLDVAADRALGHYTHEKSSVGCAAGLATLDVIRDEGLLERSRALGAHGVARLQRMESVSAVRGLGVSFGADVASPALAEAVMYRCLTRGLSFKVGGGHVLTLCPPLTISHAELDAALDIVGLSLRGA